MVVANPKGRRGAKKRRNPGKRRSGAGLFVIRKPRRNPYLPIPRDTGKVEWNRIPAGRKIFDTGKSWITDDGKIVFWSGTDASAAQKFLRGRAQKTVRRNPIKSKTIQLGNNESLSRGVYPEPGGGFLALGFSRSKTFKTRAGAERWLKQNSRASNPTMKTKRRRRAKRRNPLKLKHVLVENPRRKRRRSKRRNPARKSRRRGVSKIFIVNPMKKHRRRGARRRSKNPMARRRRRSSSRRHTRRSRNPMPAVARELFGPDMLSIAGGVVAGNVGVTMIMNRLVAGDPVTGARSFNLPGVDYSMLADPATAGTFYARNAWVISAYQLLIGGAAGYLLRNQSPRFSRGVMIGTTATAISNVLKNTGVLTPAGTLQWNRGTGRNFSAGRGTGYLPGTSTRFTGPAQAFLSPTANNVPRPRGMGAAVGPGMVRSTEAMAEGAFRGAN